MLIAVGALSWLALVVLAAGLCRVASRSDADGPAARAAAHGAGRPAGGAADPGAPWPGSRPWRAPHGASGGARGQRQPGARGPLLVAPSEDRLGPPSVA